MPEVTALYAGLITLLFLFLSYRVVLARRMYKVSVGDGGEKAVTKAMRAQANCAEYAPLGVILLLISELQNAPVWLVHILGLTLLAGRVLHAIGFSATPQKVSLRIWGMYLTLTMLVTAALSNIGHALF